MTTALFLFLAASTPPPKPVSKPLVPISMCDIVTHSEVQQAFKRPFAKGAEDRTACEYTALDQQVVAIKTQHSNAKIDARAEMLTLRKAFPEGRMRDAKGLPGTAFFLDLPGIGTQLFVIRGDHDFLLVSVMGLGDAKKVAKATAQIAHLALDRLPSVQ
jgi:hypothetical protein